MKAISAFLLSMAAVTVAKPIVLHPQSMEQQLDGKKNSLAVFYHPGLPKWQHFAPLIDMMDEHLALEKSDFEIALADCQKYPQFKVRMGLKEFPSLFYYPRGISASLALPFEYRSNKTLEEYIDEVEYYSSLSSGISQEVGEVDEQVTRFLQEESSATLRNDGIPVAPQEGALTCAKNRVVQLKKRVELKVAKLQYYLDMLEDIEEMGSSIVAERINEATVELMRGNRFLKKEKRENLLMKINILNELIEKLF